MKREIQQKKIDLISFNFICKLSVINGMKVNTLLKLK